MRWITARGLRSVTATLGFLVPVAVVAGCDDAGLLDPDHGTPTAAETPGQAAGVAAAHGAAEVQVVDVMDQPAAGGGTYAADGATLRRTPNGISVKVRMPTPESGAYAYPDGAEEGHPEAFTLWIFADGTPFLGAGHVVGGPELVLSGHVSKQTVPFDDSEPLGEAIAGADVHIRVAPHGEVDPDKLPEQIQTPSGDPEHWWGAEFD